MSFGNVYSSSNFDENGDPLSGPLPFRTFVMLISLSCHVAMSTLANYIFVEEKIPRKFDFFKCFRIR